MSRSRVRKLMAVALFFALAGPACADNKVDLTRQYHGCDGFDAASDTADNFTEFAGIFSMYTLSNFAGTHTIPNNTGAAAVADCDTALAALPAKHWMRKVSLLRARAIHHLEAASPKDALADLDGADAAAAGNSDPYYARSLGWSLDVVRAYAWRQAGDQAKASQLALAALERNPYNRQTNLAVLSAMGPKASEQDIRTVQLAISRLAPVYAGVLYQHAVDSGHYDEILKLHAQIVPPEEIGNLNITSFDQAGRDWRNFRTARLFWASRDGAYAYALAASGRNDEAIAAIAAARTRLANDTQPPPPLSAKERTDKDAVALHAGDVDIRTRSAEEGAKYITNWEAMVRLRIAASEGKSDVILAALKAHTLPRDWMSVDIIDALRAKAPPAQRKALPATEPLQKLLLATSREDLKDASPLNLLSQLPEAVTARRVPSYSQGDAPWFGHSDTAINGEGYRVSKPAADDVVTVSFRGDGKEPAVVIEEMALLCAADQARRNGKKGIVIVGREDTEFSLTTTMYATPINTSPAGYETSLKVVYVDPVAPPDRFKDASWRVLDADAVYAALAPLYITQKK
jgi:hypothetical protein